ncbi:hypothetical protein ES705_48367 [subsurface metagenome]
MDTGCLFFPSRREDIPYLSAPIDNLNVRRLQHTFESLVHIIYQIVDYIVATDTHTLHIS